MSEVPLTKREMLTVLVKQCDKVKSAIIVLSELEGSEELKAHLRKRLKDLAQMATELSEKL